MNTKYAIDANILIGPSRNIYPFDIAPGFWRQLKEKGNKNIIIIDKIKNEIIRNEDELSIWLEQNESCFTSKSSEDVKIIESYKGIINSVQRNPQYLHTAKEGFATSADSWLCAHALTYDYTVVTEEKYEPEVKKIIKIPNICIEWNIPFIDLLKFIREMGIRFN